MKIFNKVKLMNWVKMAGILLILGLIFSCQKNPVSTTPSETLEAHLGSPLSESTIDNEDNPPKNPIEEEQELADFVRDKTGSIAEPEGLSKSFAATCKIDFNSSSSLSWMVNQAFSTFATWPYYIHGCPSYWIYSKPLNLDHFHLVSQAPNQCYGTSPKWGTNVNGSCVNQSDAKYWSRIATNMGSNSGVEFYAKSKSSGSSKNVTLKRLRVKSGTVRVVVYRTDIGKWWQWKNLGVGTWKWSTNNTNLSKVRIYDTNKNGTVTFDDLELTF
ncbi:MAG: hypothetical protein NPIRA03_34430 [Nitrospirales bacterium]|nr:MAG: hypothetical protein NPIRA03_34430 [Nitrospirales bacterium]